MAVYLSKMAATMVGPTCRSSNSEETVHNITSACFFLEPGHGKICLICEQQRCRSACASAQSDKDLCFRCLDSIILMLALSKVSRL